MVKAKCPRCACKLKLGKVLISENSQQDGVSTIIACQPESAELKIALKCPICGFTTTKQKL